MKKNLHSIIFFSIFLWNFTHTALDSFTISDISSTSNNNKINSSNLPKNESLPETEASFSWSFINSFSNQQLIDAINNNDLDLIDTLSASSSRQDDFSYTPLDYAIMNRNYQAVKLLSKDNNQKNLNFSNKTLLDLINLTNGHKTSKAYSQKRMDRLLYVAATHAERPIVEILCALGANPKSTPFHNISPIKIAQKYGHVSTSEILSNISNIDELWEN